MEGANLKEIAETVGKQTALIPGEYLKVSQKGQAFREAVLDLHTRGNQEQTRLQEEIARIAPTAEKVRAQLEQGQRKVATQLDACQSQVAELHKYVEKSTADLQNDLHVLEQEAQNLAEGFQAFDQAVVDRLSRFSSQVEQDLKAQQSAQESLRAALARLATQVPELSQAIQETRATQSKLLEEVRQQLEQIPDLCTQHRETLADHCRQLQQSQSEQLTALADDTRKKSQNILQQVDEGLSQQVEAPASQAVQSLIEDGLQPRDREWDRQLPLFQQRRKELGNSCSELKTGPKLIDLIRASKDVLRKVGKLQSLGLENI